MQYQIYCTGESSENAHAIRTIIIIIVGYFRSPFNTVNTCRTDQLAERFSIRISKRDSPPVTIDAVTSSLTAFKFKFGY